MICVRFLQFLAKGRWFRRSQLTSSPAVIDNRLFRWGIVLPLSTGIRDCSFFPECPHRPWSPTSFLKVRMKAKRPALGLTTHHHLITKLIILGFVSPCIIIHSNKSTNQMHQSFFQIYCSSFKYSSTCFGHPLAHHKELINCSSRLWFTVGTWWQQCRWSWSVRSNIINFEFE